jgi:hypothetical protein
MLRFCRCHPSEKGKAPDTTTAHGFVRERLRAQGMRPVQRWVPDLRSPRILAEIRREGAALSKHPDNAAIDDRLDTVRDPGDWS